ncbi:dihydrofolate reductase [Candidatus Endobugula sertula]|uniref:Dihydrofolate reductase n=1 Tax=Candidatus Endobugula sertula TaxID=62101 RepID=A0A1D2QTH2_9GAMM|nr:dihydrofolate reductase [Candidatus Endobugula sertula]
MTLSIIVAMANNRAIGKDNNLLWHLPEDLKYFKRITMGKPIVMGRKTFESIGRPLPGRLNIVITRQKDWQHEGITVAHSIAQAIELAQAQSLIDGIDEIMVIGGAEIYRIALPQTDRLYLTRVDAEIDGDAFFPAVSENEWKEIARESFAASNNNPYDYVFSVLERV